MTSTMRWATSVIAVLVTVSGCAGGDGGGGEEGITGGGRPSVEQLADAIRGGESGLGVEGAKADCVARVLADSDLSDDALRRYTGENDAEELDDADDAAFADFIDEAEDTCDISRGGG